MIEYHGLRLRPERRRFGDFDGRHDYRMFAKRMRQLKRNRWRKQKYLAQVKKQLTEKYYKKRRRVLDQSPDHKHRELIVATSCDEFYELVVKRFNAYFCPTLGEFREIFYSLVQTVAKLNSLEFALEQEKIRA